MCFSLKRRVERYLRKNPSVKVIVVAGSFGRVSAIQALGTILGQSLTVSVGVSRHTEIPDLIILDYNSMSKFPNIQPDFVVITSCKTDEEARRYFDLANRSKCVFVNFNDVPQEYAKYLKNPNIITYGDELPADYYFENTGFSVDGCDGNFVTPDRERVPAHLKLLGEHNLRPITMAAALAHLFHVPREKIIVGAEAIRPLNGHLSPANGINGAIIIDDSADSSAVSTNLGLRAVYQLDAPSKILVAGNLDPAVKIDTRLINQVLILNEQIPAGENGAYHYFNDRLDLMAYLAKQMERDGIVLLELPFPEIIESYRTEKD